MIESPILQEIIAEGRVQGRRESLVAFLTTRFGAIGDELESDLKSIEDETRLNELIKLSASCRSLKSFRRNLSP